jgi:hypothetical protein
MKNFKKLFSIAASVMMIASMVPTATLGATTYSDELQGAYDYAYGIGITTQSSIDTANMYGTLIRSHMAKMMVNYAEEVLGMTPDTSLNCNFTDVATQTEELQGYITEACQLGLMGQGITAFNPNGVVTRAQFGTVLSRALYGDTYNGGDPYYADHLAALKDAGIMTNISNPNAPEIRGYVMLMMQRAAGEETPATCDTPENQLSCSLGLDTCPAECVTPVDANGNLDVSMTSSNGGDIPYGISSLPAATYKFVADQDIRIDSIIIKRQGYFDSTTLEKAALFMNGGRISKEASFSSTTDEATLTIANGYEVKAGETVEFTVHLTIQNDATTAGEQFNIKLLSLDSTAEDVNLASNLTSETFKIVNKASPTLTGAIGSTPENPKLGQTAAELFNFTLDNASANDQDMTLNSITFKENAGTIDEATELENFKLVVDGSTIATAAKMSGKYLIFDIEDGYLIKEGKRPTFTVKADVIGGADKTIKYIFEKAMDIVAIGDKYNQPVNVAGAGFVSVALTVSAGKVTLTRVNPPSTDILRNRKNVFLGAFEITNNAGGSLKLQDFQLDFSGSQLTGILDTVKIRLGSTTASPIELDDHTNKTDWDTTSLEKSIGSKLTVYVYADTLDQAMTSDRLRMSLSKANLVVQESSDDTTVATGDISPSSLTWSLMNGKEADLTVTKVILGDKTVAEGAEGVDAISFKIKAGTAYGAKIKKLTFTGAGIDSDTITNAVLMKGTTEIPADVNNGTIVVNEDFTIAKGETITFTLKVDIANNPELTGVQYSLLGADIEAEDTSEDQNTIDLSTMTDIAGRLITVTGAGDVLLSYDAAVTNNKYTKNVLAGTTETVAEYGLYSKYEAVNVGKAIVTFNGADTDLSTLDVKLFYNGVEVASNPTWDTTGQIATFDNLDFDTELTKAPLLVKVISKVINEDG